MRALTAGILMACLTAGCATDPQTVETASIAQFGQTKVQKQSTGFFGGVHTFPYSNQVLPGRIYATTGKASGPTFGMEVREICWSDTEAMRKGHPTIMQERTSDGESKVEKSVGTTAEFGIDGIKLPYLQVGAGANYINSAKYEFTRIKEIEVEEGTATFVKSNIQQRCKELIAQIRKQGRYVFVATKVYKPETAKVSFDFKAGVEANMKAKIVAGIAPGANGSGTRTRTDVREAGNAVVETHVEDF